MSVLRLLRIPSEGMRGWSRQILAQCDVEAVHSFGSLSMLQGGGRTCCGVESLRMFPKTYLGKARRAVAAAAAAWISLAIRENPVKNSPIQANLREGKPATIVESNTSMDGFGSERRRSIAEEKVPMVLHRCEAYGLGHDTVVQLR